MPAAVGGGGRGKVFLEKQTHGFETRTSSERAVGENAFAAQVRMVIDSRHLQSLDVAQGKRKKVWTKREKRREIRGIRGRGVFYISKARYRKENVKR